MSKHTEKKTETDNRPEKNIGMEKRTVITLRVCSVICMLMALGAMQTSLASAILMVIVSIGCLPGVQMALGRTMSPKARIIVLVVLVVLALSISKAELNGDPIASEPDGNSFFSFLQP